MIFTVQVNFEFDVEAKNEDEADSIARYWNVRHPQYRKLSIRSSFVEPEYVVVGVSKGAKDGE